jgi:HAD superfamily hydrolase (TIGR01509 family)
MLVIFDCDGVLIDSEAMTRLGHPTEPGDIARRFAGVPHSTAWATLSEEIGFAQPADWIDTILAECARRMETELQAIAGASDVLASLTRAGHAVCVASSSSTSTLETNLQRTGLWPQVAPHVFSVTQVKRPKPAPDVFLHAAAQMGFDPADCLVIEDSVAGITAARRAGMAVCGFTGGGHVYDELPGRLTEAGASHVCTTMPAILTFAEAWARRDASLTHQTDSTGSPRPLSD